MIHPLVTKALLGFFENMNKQNVRYAILRKVELIPDNIGNDIDILIDPSAEQEVKKNIHECAKEFGFKVYERQNVGGLYAILYTFIDGELVFLRLDFTNPVKNPGDLLGKRQQNEKKIYYIPEGLYAKKAKGRFKNIFSYPWRLLFPRGKFVVIIGPDGVGKSATAGLTAKILTAFHVPNRHMHLGFRPKILPTKQEVLSLGSKKTPSGESRVPGFFRFLYHTLDYYLGYLFVVRPGLVRGATVIGERYYYSYLVDPRPRERYGVPIWFFRAAYFFMPKPDLMILLSHDPEEIYKRRQEHSVEEIGRQLTQYRIWGMKAKQFLEIRTEKPLYEVAEEMALHLAPKKYELAVVATHPIQYQSPLWREIAKNPEVDLMVYYCVDWGVTKPQFHKEFFATPYKWDIPLLLGYKFKFLRNYSLKPRPTTFGLVNPGIFLKLALNSYDAVVVLGWMDVASWITFFSAFVTRTPVLLRVVNSLNYDKNVPRSKFLLFLKRLYLKILFHGFVSAFLVIGTWNREMYLELGVPKEKIFHFPYAVWNELFIEESKKYENSRSEIRKELGIDAGTKVITYAARFVKNKHPEHVIAAYEKLIKNKEQRTADVCLLMIGDGELKPELEKEAQAKGLANVKFLGFKNQRELIRFYAITDVFVRADDYIKGDWGATVNEAMACGLPIIAPDTIGAQVDLIKPGENGFVYHLSDIEALSGFIWRIIIDDKLLESMKNKSREIISNWSYKEDVDGLMHALRFSEEH